MSRPMKASGAPARTPSLENRIYLGAVILIIVAGVGGGLLASRIERPPLRPLPNAAPELSLPRPLVDFQLVDTANRPVTRADVAGRFLVVNFVFTSCSLSCRGVNNQMAAIQKRVAGMPDVQLLSLTVDPRSDTPEALADFGREFGADTNCWRFLTGSKPVLYHLIESSFIAQSPDFVGIIPGGFMHTDRIMLVDPEGSVCASFSGLRSDAAERVLDEINRRRQTLKSK